MKLTSSILPDFISDFKLEETAFGVCFDALVNFNLPLKNFNLQSDVYMECPLANGIYSIYLLNPVIGIYQMPTFFNDVSHQFLYLSGRGLVITGMMPLVGAYSISIFPKNRRCSEETYYELRAKKLN